MDAERNSCVPWFPAREHRRAVVWTQLSWVLRLPARLFPSRNYLSWGLLNGGTGTLSFPQNKSSPELAQGQELSKQR